MINVKLRILRRVLYILITLLLLKSGLLAWENYLGAFMFVIPQILLFFVIEDIRLYTVMSLDKHGFRPSSFFQMIYLVILACILVPIMIYFQMSIYEGHFLRLM